MTKTPAKTFQGRAKLPLSRTLLIVLFGVQSVFSFSASAQEKKKKSKSPARTPFYTISKETTFVTGPIAKDGHIDFVAAINNRYSKGVTPENNAAVLYLKALGPYAEGNKLPDKVFKQLGMKKTPIKGDYFLGFYKYVDKTLGLKDTDEDHEKWRLLDDQRKLAQRQPWKATEYPQLANWLKHNEKLLKLIVEGTKRSRYFVPVIQFENDDEGKEALMESWLPILQHARGFSRALACRAMLKIGEKKFEEARMDLLACHRLARHLGNSFSLMHAFNSYGMENIAFRGELIFLEHSKPTATQVSRYLQDINKLPPLPKTIEKYNFGERLSFLSSVVLISRNFYTTKKKGNTGLLSGGSMLRGTLGETELVSKRLLTPYPNWIIILKQANRTFDRVVRSMRIEDRKLRAREIEDFEKELAKYRDLIPQKIEAKSALKSNAEMSERIGKILINSMLPAFGLEVEHRAIQRHRNLILAFALAAYKSDHKNYPQKLAELSPKYLPKIPKDIFTDKPLKYEPSKNGYLLYSLGPNGVDEKGDRNNELRDGPDDIAIKMPITFVK